MSVKNVTPNPKRYSSLYFNVTALISTIREAVAQYLGWNPDAVEDKWKFCHWFELD